MNAPFKPAIVNEIHGQPTVSISTLKLNPAVVIDSLLPSRPVAILNRNREVAYIVSPAFVELAFEAMEELLDIDLFTERMKNFDPGDTVSLDDLQD